MNATNYLGKDEFKIMNNSVYGKTYQNFRKQEDINLVKKKKKVIELVPNDLLIKEMKKKEKKEKKDRSIDGYTNVYWRSNFEYQQNIDISVSF